MRTAKRSPRLDHHTAGTVGLVSERAAELGGHDAGAPDHQPNGDALATDGENLLLDAFDAAAGHHGDASRSSRRRAKSDSGSAKAPSTRFAPSTSRMRVLVGLMCRKSRASGYGRASR
jgi:hypothetical protein